MELEVANKHIPKHYRAEVSRVNEGILRVWDGQTELETNATTLVKAMSKIGIPKYTTLRHLKRLIDAQVLERRKYQGQTLYKLRMTPGEFKHVEYVKSLDAAVSKTNTRYEWEVGGAFSHLACGTIVGFPDVSKPNNSDVNLADVRFVLRILLNSAAETFVALEFLRDVAVLRSAGVNIKIPSEVLRTLLLQLHATVLDEKGGSTQSLMRKLVPQLEYAERTARAIWKLNYNERADPADPNEGLPSLNLHHSFAKLLAAKNHLKTEGLDISKYSLGELATKVRVMEEKLQEFSKNALNRNDSNPDSDGSVLFPREMSEQHSMLCLAYSVKLAELYAGLGLREKQDMALIITRSPRTMDTQTTEEHLLSEFIEGAKEYDKGLRELSSEEIARRLGKRFGEVYRNTSVQAIEALKDRPWLQKALSNQVGSFLKSYHTAVERRIRVEEQIDKKIYSEFEKESLTPHTAHHQRGSEHSH